MSETDGKELLARYTEACNYPGVLDSARVESSLREYLAALGVERKIVRLPEGWELHDYPSLERYVDAVIKRLPKRKAARAAQIARAAQAALDAQIARAAQAALDARVAQAALDARVAQDAQDAQAARAALDAQAARVAQDARAARAARDARVAQDARVARDARAARAARDAQDAQVARDADGSLHRFAAWCIQSYGWWWRFELSWIVTTYLGARGKTSKVEQWSKPLFDSFIAGCWLLHWTDDTLYWVAKPDVHVEKVDGDRGRRLHNATGPALRSDVENLYFWHGVMVPAFVVTRPEWITIQHIQKEENAEVRRVMIERYGLAKFLLDSGAAKLAEDELGELYRTEIADDEPLVMVKVMNSTPEPDGSYKPYFIRVDPEIRPLLSGGRKGEPQTLTPSNAIASTFGMTGKEYAAWLIQQT